MNNDHIFVVFHVEARIRGEKPTLQSITLAELQAKKTPYPQVSGLSVTDGHWIWCGNRYRIGQYRSDSIVGPVGVFDLDDPTHVKVLSALMSPTHSEH